MKKPIKREFFTMWVRPDLKAALRRESKRTGRSMASLIEQAVEQTYKSKPQ